MQFRRYLIPLAVAAGLAVPSSAAAATGTVTIQSADSNQVVATATITAKGTNPDGWWFSYATQVDGAQPCDPSSDGIVWLSTVYRDGDVPRDYTGMFTAPGSYSTTITFKPTHAPQTKLCIYVRGDGDDYSLVAETVADTPPAATRVRVGAICNDGWHSTATGSGACSSHGGVRYWLYSDPITPTPPATPTPPIVTAPPVATPQPTPTVTTVVTPKLSDQQMLAKARSYFKRFKSYRLGNHRKLTIVSPERVQGTWRYHGHRYSKSFTVR